MQLIKLKNNKIFIKFIKFSYGNWINLIIGLISTPIITRILSPEDFGKASMFTLVLNVIMIAIVFGTDQSFVRFFYEESEEHRPNLLHNCLQFPLVGIFVISVFCIIFYDKITIFLFDEKRMDLIILLLLGVLFQAIYRFGTLVVRMKQNANLYSILELLNKSLNFILILILFQFKGRKFEIILFSYIITIFIVALISVYKERKFWFNSNSANCELKYNKLDIIKYSAPLLFSTIITWVFQSFDRMALKNWSTLSEVGIYSAAFKIIALLNILQASFSTFWTPICYEHLEKKSDDKIFFKNAFNIVSFSMFIVAILSIISKDLLVFLLGVEYRSASYIMGFLVFIPVMYTISETSVLGINFKKKNKWHVIIAIIVSFCNIVGNYILVPKYGAYGASISTAISYIIFFSLRTYIAKRFFDIGLNLIRTYFLLILILFYSFLPLLEESKSIFYIVGILVFLIIVLLFYKDIFSLRNKSTIGHNKQ